MAAKRKSSGRSKSRSSCLSTVATLLIIAVLAAASVYLYLENRRLRNENAGLTGRIADLEEKNESLDDELRRMGKALRSREDEHRGEIMIRDIIKKNEEE